MGLKKQYEILLWEKLPFKFGTSRIKVSALCLQKIADSKAKRQNMARSYSNTLSQLSPPNELPVLIRGLVTEPDDLPKVTQLNSRQIVSARMAYMIGIMEEIEAWESTEDDEIRLNKSSLASTAIKILLFEAEVNQVSAKILLTINNELVVFENLCSHISGY